MAEQTQSIIKLETCPSRYRYLLFTLIFMHDTYMNSFLLQQYIVLHTNPKKVDRFRSPLEQFEDERIWGSSTSCGYRSKLKEYQSLNLCLTLDLDIFYHLECEKFRPISWSFLEKGIDIGYEWMNEWMIEEMKEWMNEWMNEKKILDE